MSRKNTKRQKEMMGNLRWRWSLITKMTYLDRRRMPVPHLVLVVVEEALESFSTSNNLLRVMELLKRISNNVLSLKGTNTLKVVIKEIQLKPKKSLVKIIQR